MEAVHHSKHCYFYSRLRLDDEFQLLITNKNYLFFFTISVLENCEMSTLQNLVFCNENQVCNKIWYFVMEIN
jgi:hypothetical protein